MRNGVLKYFVTFYFIKEKYLFNENSVSIKNKKFKRKIDLTSCEI